MATKSSKLYIRTDTEGRLGNIKRSIWEKFMATVDGMFMFATGDDNMAGDGLDYGPAYVSRID